MGPRIFLQVPYVQNMTKKCITKIYGSSQSGILACSMMSMENKSVDYSSPNCHETAKTFPKSSVPLIQ